MLDSLVSEVGKSFAERPFRRDTEWSSLGAIYGLGILALNFGYFRNKRREIPPEWRNQSSYDQDHKRFHLAVSLKKWT